MKQEGVLSAALGWYRAMILWPNLARKGLTRVEYQSYVDLMCNKFTQIPTLLVGGKLNQGIDYEDMLIE